MNYQRGVFAFLLPAAVFLFAALSGTAAAQDKAHVVTKGETVYSISRSYQVSPEELMRYNGITDPSRLQAGQSLRIPQGATGNAAPAAPQRTAAEARTTQGAGGYAEYRVKKNDTLYSIARSYNTPLQALRELNGFAADFNGIRAGQTIKVPAAARPAAAATGTRTAGGTTTAAEARPTQPGRIDTSLRWPVAPKEAAYMTGKLYGIVLVGERTEPVKSIIQGTVISAGPYPGFGRVAIVEVTGGYLYVYGGCESLSVKEGDKIGPGAEVGKLGIDAVSGKPQLFFMVYRSNTPIDPAKAPRA